MIKDIQLGKITPQGIKHQLANTEQIVFEVTDACNLQCKVSIR